MPKLTQAQEHARDSRDLRALQLLDAGWLHARICAELGMTRGPFARLLRDIREDEAA